MTASAGQNTLAVLGSPIAHSLSPALHAAAYRVLGLDWTYSAIEVTGASLAPFISSRDDSWRGLSLTMPLKRDVLPLLDWSESLVRQTGSANTVLFDGVGDDRQLRGFNTDVYGITSAFQRHGYDGLGIVHILGGGATAASAIAAVARLSATRVYVSVRSPERAQSLIALGNAYGIEVIVGSFAEVIEAKPMPDAVISTLPNGTAVDMTFAPATVRDAVLLDVAYHPWPSALASAWGDHVISGLEMLVLQALVQVRIFVAGDPAATLEGEATVLAAMRAAVGL